MSEREREREIRIFATPHTCVLRHPRERAATYLQKHNFAMDYFRGSNDLASKDDGYAFSTRAA